MRRQAVSKVPPALIEHVLWLIEHCLNGESERVKIIHPPNAFSESKFFISFWLLCGMTPLQRFVWPYIILCLSNVINYNLKSTKRQFVLVFRNLL